MPILNQVLIYKDEPKSYRDLPLRWGELGTVYRYERSGTLNGLFRVRGFTQDDAHIFCLPEQLTAEILGVLEQKEGRLWMMSVECEQAEILGVLDLTETILTKFGFAEYEVMLSTRPEKAVGSDEIWERATGALEGALQQKGWSYGVDEGGGAFYGPKIDIKIRDAIGRLWQCSTIQCDFNLPERFDMEYASADGTKERPIMVHHPAPPHPSPPLLAGPPRHLRLARALLRRAPRVDGGRLPLLARACPAATAAGCWLRGTAGVSSRQRFTARPHGEQVSDDFKPYCDGVIARARRLGLRAEVRRPLGPSLGHIPSTVVLRSRLPPTRTEVDVGGRSLSKQIKIANKEKVPLYAVVGAKEVEGGTLSFQARTPAGLVDGGTLPVEVALPRLELASKSGAAAIDVLLSSGDAEDADAAAPASA